MTPILFAANATDFATNGIGRLSDAISCTVHEARNGEFELELTYPVDGAHYADIVHSAIIVAKPSARRNNQAFRIYKITKPMAGTVTILAQHISYQLSWIPVSPFTAANLTNALAYFKAMSAESNPFSFSADFTSDNDFAVPIPTSIRSYMGGRAGSILDVYGGEWEWNGYNCILHRNRGQDNGYTIRYGKNLVDLKQEQNIESTYTGVYPFWQSGETMVTLPEKVIYAATVANFPFQRTLVMDFSDQWDNAPTVEQLRDYTQSFVKQAGIGIPNVNLSVDFINLADTEEYRSLLTAANIDLCDIVTVQFEKLGVSVQSKVIDITYDVLKERYASIQIGDKRSTLATTIEDQIKQISALATMEEVGRTVDRATGVLNAGRRGHVIINRNAEGWANEILFLDNENIAEAVNVLRINMNGIGFSSTGYLGPYYQAWTNDGTLSLGGVNNCFGHLIINDANGQEIGHWNKDGFLVTLGHIDLRWNGERGLFVGKATVEAEGQEPQEVDAIYVGDFMVNKAYGRQVLESSDEKTGMSGEPSEDGGLYMWAGYNSANDYRFVVNNGGAYVMYGNRAYNIGEEIAALWDAVSDRE